MLSAMLRSGRLVDYVAIGQDGSPVYKNAEAFRDAVSRISKGGPELSKFLAKPKFNLDYSQVEWYVPFDPASPDGQYRIVGWKNAREDERAHALSELQNFGRVLENFGEELLSGRPDKNTLLFAHYLTGQGSSSRLPAIHFPGPDYIYLVDGHPVLTFWGFLEQGGKIGLDPFACLKPKAAVPPVVPPAAPVTPAAPAAAVPPVPPPAAAAAQKPCEKFWAWLLGLGLWWLLLIPLLLLLLYTLWWLLFGRGFSWTEFCNVAKAPFHHEVVVEQGPGLELNGDGTELKLPQADLKGGDLALEGGSLALKGGDAALQGGDLAMEGGDLSMDGGNLDMGGGDLDMEGGDLSGSGGELPQGEGAAPSPDGQAPEAPAPAPESAAPAAEQAGADAPAPAAANEPAAPAPEAAAQTPAAPPAPDAAGELTLPAQAQNLGFLEGHWQTRSGMMDTSTGRPLNLSYDYRNNEGELVVERQDKTRCVVKAPPQLSGGRLVIEAQGKAVCPDNSSYTLPRIVCEPGADGKARCQAVYSEDNQFPLRMYN